MSEIVNKKKLCNSNHFDTSNPVAKRNTLYATIFTFVTMIVEIAEGIIIIQWH
ncbi:MAG: hypothetical protein R2837_03620 [Aliarcobacter sp.]